MKALVIFQDREVWQTCWMKPGFRHVLIALQVTDDMVVILDTGAGGIHPWAGAMSLDDVGEHYIIKGSTVVETDAEPGGTLYPTRWTCVEVVKRTLGLRAPFVLTPYQLYWRLLCEIRR